MGKTAGIPVPVDVVPVPDPTRTRGYGTTGRVGYTHGDGTGRPAHL